MNSRYDYFLIWGNGIKFKHEILNIIENASGIKILKVITYKPKRIKKLVKEVYSYDYAPFYHLKSKTKYLMKTPKEVMFVFVLNSDPEEFWVGPGSYRHLESASIKRLKTKIRDKFNERKEDRLTENHVVHASDNEEQTDKILKFLGYRMGAGCFREYKLFGIPNYITYSGVRIYETDMSNLYCSIIADSSYLVDNELMRIENSPQYAFLTNNKMEYISYIQKYLGGKLTDFYSVKKYTTLIESYNKKSFSNELIVVVKKNNKLVIVDGLHRCAILKYNGVVRVKVVEIVE